MRKIIPILLICLINFNTAFAQEIKEAKLIGTWISGEDFGEFIDIKLGELDWYLKENPNGKIVARICSANDFGYSLASVSSLVAGFRRHTQNQRVPQDRIYVARYAKCEKKSKPVFTQYWFVPENADFDYDEIVLAEKVVFKKFDVVMGWDEKENSDNRKELAETVAEFKKELKKDSKIKGYIIISDERKVKRNAKKILKEFKKEQIDTSRIRIIKQEYYPRIYPEFLIVNIKE
jgi:hypothetical protein